MKGQFLTCVALISAAIGAGCSATEDNPDFVPDVVDEADVDPCTDVERPCDEAGSSCLDDEEAVLDCVENADGCLVESVVSCNVDEMCVASEGDASCEAVDPCMGLDACEDEGVVSCDEESGELLRCEENVDGCVANVATDCSVQNPGASCIPDETSGAYCSIPETCDEVDPGRCVEPATNFCDSSTSLVECTTDDDGCLVESIVDCTQTSPTFVCRDDLDLASCGEPQD